MVKKWASLQRRLIAPSPDFVRKIAPNWVPGELLPEEVIFQLFRSEEDEQSFTNWVKSEFRELFCFIRNNFDGGSVQIYDSEEERKILA
jgi:hypothetical protein